MQALGPSISLGNLAENFLMDRQTGKQASSRANAVSNFPTEGSEREFVEEPACFEADRGIRVPGSVSSL